MKKLTALALALMLTCLLLPALAEEDYLGEWYLVEMNMAGMAINPADMGISITMTLNEDGTAAMSLSSSYGGKTEPDVDEGTWAASEAGIDLTTGEDVQAFTFADGRLTYEMLDEGVVMVFSQEAPEATAQLQAVPAETEEEFFGEWLLTSVNMMGITVSPADMGIPGEIRMIIEAGKLTEVSITEDAETPETREHETAFADGKLTFGSEEEGDYTVELLEDGALAVSVGADGLTLTMYLEKVEAADEVPAA